MSFTAKSVILDLADNWGHSYSFGLRQVDFYYDNSKIALTESDYTASATDYFINPKFLFDTTTSLTGSDSGTSWYMQYFTTEMRIVVVFDTEITFDSIVINNYHTYGGETTAGAKNVKIYVSTDSISSTVFNAAISNSLLIFDGQFDEHATSDIADPQTLVLANPNAIDVGAFGVSADLDADLTYKTLANDIHVDAVAEIAELFLIVGVADSSDIGCVINWNNSIFDTIWAGTIGIDTNVDTSMIFLIFDCNIVVTNHLAIDITEFNVDSANIFYIFTLTGANDGLDDIDIPISSFQSRLRSGKSSYLSVVIPDVETNAVSISNRPNGDMRVDMAYKINNDFVQRQALALVHLSDIRLDIGTKNQSITLTGYRQETYTSKAVTLKNHVYKSVKNGEFLFRFNLANFDLNPGDTVTVGNDSFVANLITYIVSASKNSVSTLMEVSE